MPKKIGIERVVCPYCLKEFAYLKENDLTPKHTDVTNSRNYPCTGSGSPLQAVISIRSSMQVNNN